MNLDTILVLQGGGSLGAYECGVYKALFKEGVDFNVLAGSSIGAINTSIITAAQNGGKDVPAILEDFWLNLSEDIVPNYPILSLPHISPNKMRAMLFSLHSIFYGIPKAFEPIWFMPNNPDFLFPDKWTFLYDKEPLKKTLMNYIDFNKLKKIDVKENKREKGQSRLIITSTDIQRGEPVIFDNVHTDIDADKILAGASYPFYGIRWTEKDGKYLWDGSLLTNTPMLEVIRASPINDKIFYIVDVFPRNQKEIPKNMIEVWHRARDIIFMDKTDKNIEMLKVNEKSINLLKKMYKIINSSDAKVDEKTKAKIKELDKEYDAITEKHGAAITDVI
ncbi:MAG: patatin-like phospholipase family protein, partial [Candidatus Nitrosocosmicus sp.]